MPVTTRDIARELGVSQSTVSRALQGRLVSKETIELVRKVAKEMGYVPRNHRSRSAGSTGSVGLIVPCTTNPFFGQLIDSFQSAAYANGYNLMLGTYQKDASEFRDYLNLLLTDHRVDGLAVFPMDNPVWWETLGSFVSTDIPIVVIGKNFNEQIHSVWMDYEQSARALTLDLIEMGHTRIGVAFGILGETEQVPRFWDARVQGIVRAHDEMGIPWEDDNIIVCEDSYRGGMEAARSFLSRPTPPTAIIGRNDLVAIGVLRAMEEDGVKVPEEISIAGFDNIPITELLNLTTVEADYQCLAQLAMDAITRPHDETRIGGQVIRQTILMRRVRRGTTGPAPVREVDAVGIRKGG